MSAFSKLASVFSFNVEKKINRYLVTHNLEDLKAIDRKAFLKEIYKTGKRIVVAEEKWADQETRLETARQRFKDFRSQLGTTPSEHDVLKCERAKENVEVAQEAFDVMRDTVKTLQERLDTLIDMVNQYNSLVEYQSSKVDLAQAKLDLADVKGMSVNGNSTLAGDLASLAKDLDTDIKAQRLVDSKLNPTSTPVSTQTLEERVAALMQ